MFKKLNHVQLYKPYSQFGKYLTQKSFIEFYHLIAKSIARMHSKFCGVANELCVTAQVFNAPHDQKQNFGKKKCPLLVPFIQSVTS